MFGACRDFILILCAGSAGDGSQAACALKSNAAARDVIAGRQIRLSARARIGIESSCQFRLDCQFADRDIQGNMLIKASNAEVELGLPIVERIYDQSDARCPIVTESIAFSITFKFLLLESQTGLEGEPAKGPGILDEASLIPCIGGDGGTRVIAASDL